MQVRVATHPSWPPRSSRLSPVCAEGEPYEALEGNNINARGATGPVRAVGVLVCVDGARQRDAWSRGLWDLGVGRSRVPAVHPSWKGGSEAYVQQKEGAIPSLRVRYIAATGLHVQVDKRGWPTSEPDEDMRTRKAPGSHGSRGDGRGYRLPALASRRSTLSLARTPQSRLGETRAGGIQE